MHTTLYFNVQKLFSSLKLKKADGGYAGEIKKIEKAKSVFPNDTSLMKILYLATMEVTKKWTGRMKDWSIIVSQLNIYFKERIESYVV